MGKRSILIIKIKPTLSAEHKNEIVKNINESIHQFGIVIMDENIVDANQVTVEGLAWEE